MPIRVAPRRNGEARNEWPSRRGTVFMLRPAVPNVEAHRAQPKFLLWLFVGEEDGMATSAIKFLVRSKLSYQKGVQSRSALKVSVGNRAVTISSIKKYQFTEIQL